MVHDVYIEYTVPFNAHGWQSYAYVFELGTIIFQAAMNGITIGIEYHSELWQKKKKKKPPEMEFNTTLYNSGIHHMRITCDIQFLTIFLTK